MIWIEAKVDMLTSGWNVDKWLKRWQAVEMLTSGWNVFVKEEWNVFVVENFSLVNLRLINSKKKKEFFQMFFFHLKIFEWMPALFETFPGKYLPAIRRIKHFQLFFPTEIIFIFKY